jgi:hypothetical protein
MWRSFGSGLAGAALGFFHVPNRASSSGWTSASVVSPPTRRIAFCGARKRSYHFFMSATVIVS